MNERGIIACIFMTILSIAVFFPQEIQAAENGNQWTGPWVDKLVYKVIPNESDRFIALIDGEVDIIGGQISPSVLDNIGLGDIQVSEVLQLGYGITEINCMKYPMNITDFRRAIAFAVDKHRIIEEGWLGLAHLLDCHIPKQHPASIEEEMTYHYYDKQIENGTKLLAQAGFLDGDDDGWLEGPGPEGPGTIELETIIVESYPTSQVEIFVDVIVQAMLDLGINSEVRYTSLYDYDPKHPIFFHDDYDMLFHEKKWSDFDLDYFARDMSTEYIRTPCYNLPNWSNASWDALVPIILHSTDYDEIIETSKQMEHIWVHSCPGIIMYQSTYFTIFKTDKFEGVTPTILEGAPNFFTNLRIHPNNENNIGGTYTWANPLDILSYNHYSVNSDYAQNILNMLFDPLVRVGPDGNDIPWMCESYSIETHNDNSAIPENHTRITVDVVRNATWSDGTPITADDYAFSLNFMRDHVPIAGAGLVNMVTCYPPATYVLLCEFDSESYWHWHAISYKSVIPRQIWLEYADAYDEYQPSPATINEMVLSGPFLPVTWKQGEYTELVQNPLYFRNPRHLINGTITNTHLDNETSQSNFELSIPNLSLIAVGVVYGFIIVVLTVDYIRTKRAEGG